MGKCIFRNGLVFRVGVNYFSSAEKLFMHEEALFVSDLLKAREIITF